METRKNPHGILGRVAGLISPRSAERREGSAAGKVSLAMGNQIMGDWLWIKGNLR